MKKYCYAIEKSIFGNSIARFESKEERAKWIEVEGSLSYSKMHDAYWSDKTNEWEEVTAKEIASELRKARKIESESNCGWTPWDYVETTKVTAPDTEETAHAELLYL